MLYGALHTAGVTRLAGWWNRRRVTILCYHGVTERPERAPEDHWGLHVRRDRFEAHVGYLSRHYRVIPLREYVEARASGRTLPPYTAVLTFDDGYRNVLTVAAPILRAARLPASVFVVTDRVGASDTRSPAQSAWEEGDDRSSLSWADVHALVARGIEIGSHTCSHADLVKVGRDAAGREVTESHAAIAAALNVDAMAFAYPKGRYTDEIVDAVRKAGYYCALTTEGGGNDSAADRFKLHRTLIGDNDDEASFASRVSGLIPSLSASWFGRAARGARNLAGRVVRPSQRRGETQPGHATPTQPTPVG
jgi:peptidoglycan/xylan/chitin deacetylase (PgdA/CDA1 family)